MRRIARYATGAALLLSFSAAYAATVPVSTKKVLDISGRAFKFLTKGNVTPVPQPSIPPTAVDGLLRVCTDADPVGIYTPLPAANWKGLGNPPGTKGYKYKDPNGTTFGGCKVMVIKGAVFKANCASFAFLGHPFTGNAVRTRVKIGDNDYCHDCDVSGNGTVVKNDSQKLIIKDCAATSCLCASPSGAFVDAAEPF